MTRIDFYQSAEDELAFTCRLIHKAYRQGLSIYVHTADAAQAERLDEALWTFRPDSFIAHALQSADADTDTEAPVIIGHSPDYDHASAKAPEVLVNLSNTVPDFFTNFNRVAEIVPANKAQRLKARENFNYYKEANHTPQYHKL